MSEPMSLSILRPDNFQQEILDEQKLVLLACIHPGNEFRKQSELLKTVASRFDGGLKVCLLTHDGAKAIMDRFRVEGTPTYILLRQGREKERLLGETDLDTLSASVQPLLAAGSVMKRNLLSPMKCE
jgi:thioredoxin-like negative regulator of GroEL